MPKTNIKALIVGLLLGLLCNLATAQLTPEEYHRLVRERLAQNGGTPTGDLGVDVAQGLIEGLSQVNKFGRNPDIDTATDPEDVWNGGGDYTGQPDHGDASETVDVYSSSADDAAAGTGARTVELAGLAGNWRQYTEKITLSGTTPVASVRSWRRIYRIKVLTAGSGGENAGTITCEHTTTSANVFAVMPTNRNQTAIAAYTVPGGKTGYLQSLHAAMTMSAGASGSADISTLR